MNGINHFFKTPTHVFLYLCVMALVFSSIGCGAVGPPIAPEKVGIEAKVRKQQQEKARKEGGFDENSSNVPLEEEVELPSAYPIDIR